MRFVLFHLIFIAGCLQPHPGTEDESGTTLEPGSTGDSSETTAELGSCGDGTQDVGEGCDDGNRVDEDGCPSGEKGKCQAEAKCGDGFVWAGKEECDDGNVKGGDGCEADCRVTPAECGNGVKEVGEGCDDGNDVDEDECPSGAVGQCKGKASCGDGVVWKGVEGCDDGNGVEEDGCPSGGAGQCKGAASCGDGFVWVGMEVCDDGNKDDTDGCPSGGGACKAVAKCGDGFVEAGAEDCDDMNTEDLDGCNNACVSPRWVFVTSKVVQGNMGGLTGADDFCQEAADSVGLGGKYMAWLTGSDPSMAPVFRFESTEFTGWYVLPTDPPTPVARGWSDLTTPNADMLSDYLRKAISIDENQIDVGDKNIWTNTNPDGTQQSLGTNCTDWTIGDGGVPGMAGRAKAGLLGEIWTMNKENDCNSEKRLYCFQVE